MEVDLDGVLDAVEAFESPGFGVEAFADLFMEFFTVDDGDGFIQKVADIRDGEVKILYWHPFSLLFDFFLNSYLKILFIYAKYFMEIEKY